MKYFLLLLLLYTVNAAAQNTSAISYPVFFSAEFNICEKEEAVFSGAAFVTGKNREVVVYHANGEKAYTASYKDKLLKVRQGMCTWYGTNGIKLRICNYNSNILNGPSASWYDNGKMRDSGYYSKGYPDAAWKSWYPSGAVNTIITFSAKKMIDFKETYASRPSLQQLSSSYDVFTSSGAPLPYLLYGTNDATKIYAYAKANKYNLAVPAYLDVDKYQNARANERALSGRRVKKNERDSTNTNLNAMANGLYQRFFENGNTIDSGYFKDGVKNGVWKSWNENGQIKTVGKYENSRMSGEWKFYDENGKLQYVRQFKWNGTLANEIKMN